MRQADAALEQGEIPNIDEWDPPRTIDVLPPEQRARAEELLVALNVLHQRVERQAEELSADLDDLMQRRRALTAYTAHGHRSGAAHADPQETL